MVAISVIFYNPHVMKQKTLRLLATFIILTSVISPVSKAGCAEQYRTCLQRVVEKYKSGDIDDPNMAAAWCETDYLICQLV